MYENSQLMKTFCQILCAMKAMKKECVEMDHRLSV
jgi:hypothetical protein